MAHGFDLIRGGADDDLLYGGDRGDTLIGGIGNDTLNGDAGNDRLDGNDGDDRLDGGAGQDNLFGGDGADTLLGGADNDRIFAGEGDDLIDGGTGNDTIFGSGGVDTFVFELGHGDDIIRDFDPNGEIIDLTALGTSFGALTIAHRRDRDAGHDAGGHDPAGGRRPGRCGRRTISCSSDPACGPQNERPGQIPPGISHVRATFVRGPLHRPVRRCRLTDLPRAVTSARRGGHGGNGIHTSLPQLLVRVRFPLPAPASFLTHHAASGSIRPAPSARFELTRASTRQRS